MFTDLCHRGRRTLPAQFSSHKMRHLLSSLSYFLPRSPDLNSVLLVQIDVVKKFQLHYLLAPENVVFQDSDNTVQTDLPVFCIVRVAEAELHVEGICHQNLRSRAVQFRLQPKCSFLG